MKADEGFGDYTDNIQQIADAYLTGDERCRREALRTLIEIGTPEARRLLKSLIMSEDDKKFRYYCRKALAYLYGEAVGDNTGDTGGIADMLALDAGVLREEARDDDPWIRLKAVTNLSRYFDESDFDSFFSDLLKEEEHPYVRSALVMAVGRHGNASHIPQIAEFLRDRDSRVQANAVEALEMIGTDEIYHHLVPLLQDVDNRVRANAAKVMAAYRSEDVLRCIQDMLDSDKVWERDSAAYALGELNIQGSAELLEEIMDDPGSGNVRQTAWDSLAKLAARENTRAMKILEEHPSVSVNPDEMLDLMEAL